jgi:small subunit ribosomal protein S7
MPRRKRPPRRRVEPDIRYNSAVVTKIINKIMKGGNKSVASRIVYDALDIIEQRTGRPPLEVLEQAVRNVEPVLEVKPRRVGGSTYQIPVEVRPYRQSALAIRWILRYPPDGRGEPRLCPLQVVGTSRSSPLGLGLRDAQKPISVGRLGRKTDR